jgi:hypothetical protein
MSRSDADGSFPSEKIAATAQCRARDAIHSTGISAMKQLMRFGRRVPLPSTAQILRELRVAQRDDDLKTHSKIITAEATIAEAPKKDAGPAMPPGGDHRTG